MGKRRSKSILQLLYRTLNQNDLYSQKAISLTMLWLAHNSFDKKEPKKNFFTELCNYFSPLMPQTSTQVSNKRMTVDFKIDFWRDNSITNFLRICNTNRKCIPYINTYQIQFFPILIFIAKVRFFGTLQWSRHHKRVPKTLAINHLTSFSLLVVINAIQLQFYRPSRIASHRQPP